MNKNILAALLFTLSGYTAQAQLKSPFTSIKPQLSEVIKDFPYNYRNIKGQSLNQVDSCASFASKIEIKDAIETTITSYITQKYQTWVWESVLFQTDDIKVLQQQYKAYYNDISGKALFKNGVNGLTAVSAYNAPAEELRLWSNQFRMQDDETVYRNLVVDLVAEYVNFQWTVYVRVFDKVKDEEIRPTEKN
jgi:hypothetical protein